MVQENDKAPISTPYTGLPKFHESVLAYFGLWRYRAGQLVLCFVCMYLGWVALAGGLDRSVGVATWKLAVAVCSATCALIAIFLLNDAADREIDRIVHPERPIPQGRSRWQHIFCLGAALLGLSVMLGPLVSTRFTYVIAALACLTAFHYGFFKHRFRLPCSSEIVTPMMSVLFPVTAFFAVPRLRADMLLLVIAFIYFADFAQDLLGGIHDKRGDRSRRVGTFALTLGSKTTLMISVLSFLLSVAAGWRVHAKGQLGWIYLGTFAVLVVLMLCEYVAVFRASDSQLEQVAGRANHLGGYYFFIVSASILPDFILRHLDIFSRVL